MLLARFQMKKRVIYLSLLFIIIMSPLINSDESFTFQKGQTFTLDIPIANNNLSDCDDCSCQMSIFYPNGTVMVRKGQGTIVNSNCQYSDITEVIGIYGGDMVFNNSVDYGRASFELEITASGSKLGTAESIIYILFIVVLMFMFCFFMYASIMIPFRNPRGDDGKIININDMRYLKVGSMVFSYLILMALFGIMRQITANYLFLSQAHKTFQWLYWFMLSFTFPIIVVSIILMLVMFVENKKIKNALERGVPFR